MSSSVGFGVLSSSAAAASTCPDWQYPHCGTSNSFHASCTGCVPSADSPSIVVMGVPTARPTGSEHDRTASPLTSTVQAPHWPIPQPYFVPVNPIESRRTHSSGVSGSTSTAYWMLLTRSVNAISPLLALLGLRLVRFQSLEIGNHIFALDAARNFQIHLGHRHERGRIGQPGVQVLFRPDDLRLLERVREIPPRDGSSGAAHDAHEVRAEQAMREIGCDRMADRALLIEDGLSGLRIT